MTTPATLRYCHLVTLEAQLTLSSGTVLPVGCEVMLLPQTTASSVLAENGKTLADILPALNTNVVDASGQVARLTDRLTQTEITLAALKSWAQHNGYTNGGQ